MTNTATVTQERVDAGHLTATGTESASPTQATALHSSADTKSPSAAPPPYISGQQTTNQNAGEIQPVPAATAAPTSTVNEKVGNHQNAEKKQPSPNKNQKPPPTHISLLHHIGRDPALVICPACKQMGVTNVQLHAGDNVAMWSLITCLCLGLIFAWIPCVIPSCKDAEHYCSNCGVLLGTRTGKDVVELSETGHMENVEEVKRQIEQMRAARQGQQAGQQGESAWTKPGLQEAPQPVAQADVKSEAHTQAQETGVITQTPSEK